MTRTSKARFVIRILTLICLAAALPGGLVLAAPGDTTRVSVSSSGVQGNAMSRWPEISGDGNYVAFISDATTLVPNDTNGTTDVFVHNRQTGVTERVSLAGDGSQANNWSESDLAISRDGRYVAFASLASNLIPVDTNNVMDVFVHDRHGGQTLRASLASGWVEVTAPEWADYGALSLSNDGRFIVFTSDVSTLVSGDTNEAHDIFVHDMQIGTTRRVSVSSTGEQGNGGSYSSDISGDGQWVVFRSDATNLVPNDTNGRTDIFLHNLLTGETTRLSVSASGEQADKGSNDPTISNNGRYVAFRSAAENLLPGYEIYEHVYVRDLQTGEIKRASVWSDGYPMVGWAEAPTISDDGRYVAFEFDDRGDSMPIRWIYVRDLVTSQTIEITVGDSEGQGSPFNPSLSADGRFLAFDSGDPGLVSGDTNGVRDVFVREGPFVSEPIPNPLPTVVSIQRADPDPTFTMHNVRYTVTFSEAVGGVDASDFVLAKTGATGAAAITGVNGWGATYTVSIYTGNGQGSLRLDLIDNDSILDAMNQPLGGTGTGNGSFTGGQVYRVFLLQSNLYRSNGANDGWVLETGENTNLGGALNATNDTFYLGDNAQDRQFRVILHFPTSSLPDNAVIYQAVLRLKKQSAYGTDPFTTHQNLLVDIRYGPFSGSNTLQSSDFEAAPNENAGIIFNTPSGTWYSSTLEPRAFPYINVIGVTQLRLAFQLDDNDNLVADTVQFYSGDHADLAYRPQLQIQYYVP